MKKQSVKKITFTALFAALIAVMTAFIKMPTGINEGYLHFGDSMIYLAGCLLGALADILAGAAVWAPATAIIKALNAVPFIVASHFYFKNKGKQKIVNWYTVPMVIVSGLITIFGYLLAEGLMYSFPSAWTSVPFSIIQAVGSAIVFIILGCALDAVKIQKLMK